MIVAKIRFVFLLLFYAFSLRALIGYSSTLTVTEIRNATGPQIEQQFQKTYAGNQMNTAHFVWALE